jgi:ABC-type lipoprotein export system ATPase subunit
MIELRSVEFHYDEGDFRLRVPMLRVAEGERLAVVGPSGCGKTTLLHLVAGIQVPHRGEVSVGDLRVDALSDAARRDFRIGSVGFVFQDFELLDYLDVYDNILHPYRINRSLRLTPEVRQRVRELARQMGIEDKLRRNVGHLSQGERQRAAVCRALVAEPRVILADEATGNLDPENKSRVMKILHDYAVARGGCLLAVTHDHQLLPAFDRVVDLGSLANAAA